MVIIFWLKRKSYFIFMPKPWTIFKPKPSFSSLYSIGLNGLPSSWMDIMLSVARTSTYLA